MSPVLCFSILLLLGLVESQNSLRGFTGLETVDDELLWNVSSLQSRGRILQQAPKFFRPLECNAVKCANGITTWTKLGLDPSANPVVIPCGTCVTMDYSSGSVLELAYGLDIQGTLIFLSGYRITLVTPFVLVQGNLEISSVRPVSDRPDVVFRFTGKSNQSFIPAANNKLACSADGASDPGKCQIGFKPFVVAGGKVTIQGFKASCVTWTKLYDVSRGNTSSSAKVDTFPLLNARSESPFCRSWSFMEENFSTSSNQYLWTGGYGAYFQINNGTFVVSGRKSDLEHGPTWDMLWIRSCLLPKQKYLFSARIKLNKFGANAEDKTECAISNQFCLMLISSVRTTVGGATRTKKMWEMGQDIRFGRWYDFYSTFEFDEFELNQDNVYQILRIRGPEAGVDIELDDVRFSLPDPKTLPDPLNACGGNLILNGAAEAHPIHPYPFGSFGGFLSVEEEITGNQYFHHSGRGSDSSSLIYSFPVPGCLATNAMYKVSVSLRVNSDVPIDTLVEIRSDLNSNSSIQKSLFVCRGANRVTWKVCSAVVSLPPELLGPNAREIRLQFETIGAPYLDMDFDNLAMELVQASATSLIVPAYGIGDCWSKGSDVLITSHTLNYEDSQVRTLAAKPTNLGNGYVRLDLNQSIVEPITLTSSRDFAVEIALLSRNILFESEADPLDSLLGAHFMVMQTPGVPHLIDGAEFRDFGQQGILGRYPIHFHLCENATGAIVRRNSIRYSKQRCVVIHGSNGLIISDNVAFDTRGHCYMLEDGGEVDNLFRRNLGAKTLEALRPVSPSETDHLLPSTFWCTNPQNSWIGNVAAGSSDSGFWFELRDAVRGPTANMPLSKGMIPRRMALTTFRQNIAHSNGKHGIRTYPFGYLPSIEANFVENLSFRNMEDGFFIHNSKNIAITGGVLADNAIQVDIDRGAQAIRVEATSLIGLSESFRASIKSKPGVSSHSESLVGIQLHGVTFLDDGGAEIRSVKFSGFDNTNSKYVALIDIDDLATNRSFDFPVSVSDVNVEGDIAPLHFDFTKALSSGIENIYIIDLTSGMKPKFSTETGISAVVSNSTLMNTFLANHDCEIFSVSGYKYCYNTCIRTMVYSTNPSMTEKFQLRITNDGGLFVDVRGGYDMDPDPLRNDWLGRQRKFVASLPLGKYKAFFHTGDGVNAWPTHVEASLMNKLCEGSFDANDVQLDIPSASIDDCQQLVRNGNFEDILVPNYWLQNESGMKVTKGGLDGTNAITDVIQSTETGSLGQFLDTRCFQRGRQFEVQAWVKLSRGGSVFPCDSATKCPVARIGLRTPSNTTSSAILTSKYDVASSFIRPYNSSGWNLLHGIFSVDSRMQAASSVSFFVERRRTGVAMMLDNVSVRMLPRICTQLVFNGDFEEGTSRFWSKSFARDSLVIGMKKINENWALEMSGRSSSSDSPQQDVRVRCMFARSRYLASARFRLLSTDRSPVVCNPSYEKECPRMILRSLFDVGLQTQLVTTRDAGSIAVTDHQMTSDGWYTMSGVFSASKFDEQADRLILSWDQVSEKAIFIVDDVSIIPLPKTCDQLILNGNIELDETPRFWRVWVDGGGSIAVKNDGIGNRVLSISRRVVTGDGIYQFVDPACMVGSDAWLFSARLKITSSSSGLGVICQPADTGLAKACPPVRITGWKGSTVVIDKIHYMTNRVLWEPDTFNKYVTEFVVDSVLRSCDRIAIGIRQYNVDWDLIIDDVSVIPKVI